MEIEEEEVFESSKTLPLLSFNHLSLLVRCVKTSATFYQNVLGFALVKRPSSFDFHGAWLYNYGIGIHLLEGNSVGASRRPLNPKDNHVSFQCGDMNLVKKKLEAMRIKYVSTIVEDEGIKVEQVFFHDPDGYMIEICDCENLPVLPISSSSCPLNPRQKKSTSEELRIQVSCAIENIMMESLRMELMNFSF